MWNILKNQKNILTIDVEDWFTDLNYKYWDRFKDTIVHNVELILKILKENNAAATFFIVGYFAKKYPELVEKIFEANHEIGSHGYNHIAISDLSPEQFEKDLIESKIIIEKIIGEKIWGYRAPFFTITEETSWAITTLKNNHFKYDSSVFPFKIYKYGIPNAPTFPYRISLENIKKIDNNESFLEFPLSTYRIPFIRKNIPIAGGFYLRFFPLKFITFAIKSINKKKHPAIIYTHPWEFNPNNPRINSIVWYNYYRLNTTEKKFRKLLNDFQFTSIRDWMENEL